MNVLSLTNASYEVEGKTLVREVSLDIEAGDFVGLLGPNGSGKTTLVRLMTGVWKPKSGHVSINGRDASLLSRVAFARCVAAVPQDAPFSFPYAVEDVVAMGRYARMTGSFGMVTEHDRQIVRAAMEKTDCLSLVGRSVQTLSGGEKQRVLIARALAQGTNILVMDEPTAHLDLRHQRDLGRLFKTLRADGLTILCVMHDLDLAAFCCNKVALLREGKMAAFGPTENVLTPEILKDVFEVDFQDTLPGARRAMRWE
jgi:iron complex transport system ATP-binding protein